MALIAPHTCVQCAREGSLLCDWCAPDAALPLPERCYRCGVLSSESAVCASCRRHTPLRQVWVRAQYDAAPKILLYKLKFGRASAAVVPITDLMAEAMPYLTPSTLLVPVPTATSRVRLRGYDQAGLIAKRLAMLTNTRYTPLLRRSGQSRQLGATGALRREQLSNAYRVSNPAALKGQIVVLVDDVLTTGATIEAAAACVRKAGAKAVYAAVFAQRQLTK